MFCTLLCESGGKVIRTLEYQPQTQLRIYYWRFDVSVILFGSCCLSCVNHYLAIDRVTIRWLGVCISTQWPTLTQRISSRRQINDLLWSFRHSLHFCLSRNVHGRMVLNTKTRLYFATYAIVTSASNRPAYLLPTTLSWIIPPPT